MKKQILTALITATTAFAGTVDGPAMIEHAPGIPPKPLLAHWPAPGYATLGTGAPWAWPALAQSPMSPDVILFCRAVSNYDYMNGVYNFNRQLGMVWSSATGTPIPNAAPLPSAPPLLGINWTGFGVGPSSQFFINPVPPSSYMGGLPFHNDEPNGMGVTTPVHTVGGIPNAIVFPSRAPVAPFSGSDEVMFIYQPVNGLPMKLNTVEVEDLTYRSVAVGGGFYNVLIETCSVYRNNIRIATFMKQGIPATLRASFDAHVAGLNGALPITSPSILPNNTLRMPVIVPNTNRFTMGRIDPALSLVNPGDQIVLRYDDFGFRVQLVAGVYNIVGVNPVIAGFNGNGWALSAISGQQ